MPELDDEAITITLPEDYLDGTGDGGSVKVTPVEKAVEKVVDDPVADLKGQFETMKGQLTQRAAHAEQRLAETNQELQAARKEVVSSQLDTVTTGLQAAEAEAESAEQEWAAAAEAGDFVKQAKATRRMNQAQIKIDRLKEAEGDLKEQTKAPPRREVQRQETQRSDIDPVEHFTKDMRPRAAAWIKAHPDCVTNRTKNAQMLAVHFAALDDGLKEGGDDYFARLDEWVGSAKTTVRAAQTQQEAPKAQVRPSSAAAPAGNAGGGMNGGGQDVMLTMREKLAAEDGTHTWSYDDPSPAKRFRKGDAIGVQEFARRKMIMKKQGLYDRTLTES